MKHELPIITLRSGTSKLNKASVYHVPASGHRLDSRLCTEQFPVVRESLRRIQMRLAKAKASGNARQVTVLSDLEAKAVANLQRLASDIARFQDGAQAVSDRAHKGRSNFYDKG